MFTRRALTFSVLVVCGSLYLYLFEHYSAFVWPLCVGVLMVMTIFVFQHQLDWWWYKKFPPTLAPEMKAMYMRSSVLYAGLNPHDMQRFDTRACLFVESKEFIAQGTSSVAEDVKYMVAYYAVLITLHKKDYLFEPYNRIVIYLHPFLSPHFPDQIHAYEIEHEDGTIIFSLEQFVAGFVNPSIYYQTGLHAFAQLFTQLHPDHSFIESDQDPVDTFDQIGLWSREKIEDFTGMMQDDPIPVLMHYFFTNGDAIRENYPDMYMKIANWLSYPLT